MTTENIIWSILYLIFCSWGCWKLTGRANLDMFTTKVEIVILRIFAFILAPSIFLFLIAKQISKIFIKNWEDL